MTSGLPAFVAAQGSSAQRRPELPRRRPRTRRADSPPCAGHCIQSLEPRLLLALFESDIVAVNVTGVEGAYDVGERITARAHFRNDGNIGTGAFTVRFYLARTGNNQVAFIESGNVTNVSPLIAWSEDINVPGWAIPHENHAVTPGRYRIAAYLDWGNAVEETLETNNIAFSPFFDIRHPDLVTESVTGVDTQYAPGSALNVTATVLNSGTARAWASLVNPYRVAFYLGADQSTAPDPAAMTLLQTGWIQGNLDNGERTTDLLNTLVPLSTWPGRYRIWVNVDSDDELVESNENNNWRGSSAFTVSGPDLKPLRVTRLDTYYTPTFGQFINADVTVQNIGATAVAASSLHWYLGPAATSTLPTAGSLQLLQDADIRPMLSGGETSDHLLFAVPGLQTGEYRIWAHADPGNDIGEQDESNNWSYSDAFRIISIGDLRWEDAAGNPLTGDVDEGTEVYISFDASGFNPDGYIPVEIWEDDVLDDELERADLRVLYDDARDRWRAPWWPAAYEDAGGTDPEFYFHVPADHLGFTFGYSSSNLGVKPRLGPDLACDADADPNPADFGFQISRHTLGTGVPLVLVHGNNSDTAGKLYRWQWFENHIRNNPDEFAEFDVFVWRHDTCKPVGFNGAADSQAASLADYIYDELEVGVPGTTYENKRVALVAHSQGGMVSRSFMNHDDQGDDVSGLITLGTPHHGSPFGVPDWVSAVWEATGGTEAVFNILRDMALDAERQGSINLAWDNFDRAIVDRSTSFGDDDLTDQDVNDAGTYPDDRTPFYTAAFKNDYGTLADLNRAEAFYHKLVTIGAYDPSYADNAGFAALIADVIAGKVSPDMSSDHKQLSAVTTILGNMSLRNAGNANASPYYANDGLVPLQSALFLNIAPHDEDDGGGAAAFSSLDGDTVTIDAGLIAARTPRDLKAYYFSVGAKDHQDILDTTSSQYWQRITDELRMLLDDVLPTASLHVPSPGDPVGVSLLNSRGYFDVTYEDLGGSGLDPRSILDEAPEFLLAGPTAVGVELTSVERREGNTYRYSFTGQFGRGSGSVSLSLLPGAFGDDAGNTNAASQLRFVADGDANADGTVNSDDYFRIDSGFLAEPTAPTYAQGDFNDDDEINSDDYFIIDREFLRQLAPSATSPAPTNAFSVMRVAVADVVFDNDDNDDDDDARRRRSSTTRTARDYNISPRTRARA